MANVKLEIAGRPYTLSCGPGEEERVMELGARLDSEAQAIASKVSFVSEAKLLLMTALQIADAAEGSGAENAPAEKPSEPAGLPEEMVASLLNSVAEDIESIAASLPSD